MILPKSIWDLIFQFDITYHEKYRNDVLKELKRINWKVIWINREDKKIEYGAYRRLGRDDMRILE